MSIENRPRQKNKKDWDKLIAILDGVEKKSEKEFTEQILELILVEIYRLLANVVVTYPTPNRISINDTIQLVQRFTEEKSGGDRIEAIATSLFSVIGEKFNLFDDVKREKVNAADASSGMVADIECSYNEEIVLLVEVKDRELTLTQMTEKLDTARSRHISEILFMTQKGINSDEENAIASMIEKEFNSGQNVYVTNILEFARGILILLGERGRVEFLKKVGPELDRVGSSINHRKDWAEFLRNI